MEGVFMEENDKGKDWIAGRNPVMEALKSGRAMHKLLIVSGDREGSILKIIQMAKESGIPIHEVDRKKLEQTVPGQNHQGVAAQVAAYEYADLETVLEANSDKEVQIVVLLDGLEDPHNLGSILRSAHAAGVVAVVIPKRRSVGLTATVAKTSAGAIEHIPVCRVSNLSQTIEFLQKRGFWAAAADAAGTAPLYETDLRGKLALVVGSEGEGVGRLLRERCDYVLSIPMVGKMSSLNASVATGIILYEVLRQNAYKKKETKS